MNIAFKYKTSEESNWTDGGELTATIKDNTFNIQNLSLGNIFDYQKEYHFKVIVSDLIMSVGDSTGDIQVVEKGQEVVAIGEDCVWVYGELLLNDENLLDKIPTIKQVYSESTGDVYGCDYINEISKDVYSSEEVKTNKVWIDGKTIYRRCFTGTTANSFYTEITKELNSINCSVKNAGGFLTQSDSPHLQMTIGGYINANWTSGVYLSESSLNIYHASNLGGGTYELFVEYTKATE